ncbi:hypothetical protein ABPG74_017413 [Tetrahymena malaccensis]
MKYIFRNISILLFFFKLSIADFVASQLSQITETAFSCNIQYCTECPNNPGGTASCTRCQLGYFLYQIPYPNYSQSTISYIPCGDCVDNPSSWQVIIQYYYIQMLFLLNKFNQRQVINKQLYLNSSFIQRAQTRQCTYYYTINANTGALRDLTSEVIMKVPQVPTSLFLVSVQQSGSSYTSTVQECLGCLSFCGNNLLQQGCNQFKSPSTNDLMQAAVICRYSYYWDKNSCNNQCSADLTCQKCKKVNNQPICMVCIDGYTINQNGICVQCSSVIPNCQQCYYGDDSGRNYSQDPSNFVGQSLPANTYLRCSKCAQTQSNQAGGSTVTTVLINVQMIPSLDLKQCLSCPNNCLRCDYSTTQNGQDIHSLNPRIIPTNQQGSYNKRCRVCASGYVLNPNGNCEVCSIQNCQKCAYGTNGNPETYYTLNVNNFSIQDSTILPQNNYNGNTVFCAVCNKGYNRKSDGTCDQNVPSSCISSVKGQCLICNDGYVSNNGNCNSYSGSTFSNCGQYYTATSGQQTITYCLSCDKYGGQNTVSSGYPNYNTNSCSNCDSTGVCSQCTQWNWRFNLIDYFEFARPYLTSSTHNFSYYFKQQFFLLSKDQFSSYEQTLQLQETPWCLNCNSPNIQDPWTGYCYGCLSSCDGCSPKFGLPNCYKCNLSSVQITSGLTVKRSQNLSKIGCTLCSDYEQNCMEISSSEQQQKNPYYTNSAQFGNIVRWTKANQCRTITNDVGSTVTYYANRYMFFNSYNQKCQVCQTSSGCKKQVIIPYYFDTTINQNQDISTYNPNTKFTGYYAYSLPYLSSQEMTHLDLNLREALQFSQNFVKFAQEGVEQIVFQIIFVGNSLDATYLTSAALDFNLQIISEAFSMIPTLIDLKASVNTMLSGNFNSIGSKKMKIYIKDSLIFNSFSTVEFNNVEFYPIQNSDPNALKNPFFIQLTNVLKTSSVIFNNCVIGNTNSINAQLGDYTDKGTSQYFSLIAPNMISLNLNNFVLNQIYYPPKINFYDPGTANLATTFTLNTVQFTGLSFQYIAVFSMNNTNSQISFTSVQVSGTSFDNSYLIYELEGLKESFLRFDLNQITFSNLNMVDSFLVYVMNAVRFKASQWTFQGPFTALSSTKITSLICTNLISISGVTVTSSQQNRFYLNTVTMFSTPSYSLLVQNQLQINHRYTTVTIDSAKCNLAANTNSLSVYSCFFDLNTPYNPKSYMLNALLSSVTIQNTFTDQTQLQLLWKLININTVNSLQFKNINILRNQKFQGIYVYNPVTLSITNFKCGDPDTTVYSQNIPFQGLTSQLDQSKLHGFCLNAVFCQSSFSADTVILQNYSGLDQSAFQIICTEDILKQSNINAQIPVTINNFSVSNSVIFQDLSYLQVSPLQIVNKYSIFNIQISNTAVSVSQLSPLNQLTLTTYSSSTVLLVDSIESYLTVTNSKIFDTTCLFSQNAFALTVNFLTVQNVLFRNGNKQQQANLVSTSGGFVNARAGTMNFIDVNFQTSVANFGGALYLITVSPGIINISGSSKFYQTITTTNSLTDGSGGAIYVDCTQSPLTMVIDGVTFEDVQARTVGALLYLSSGPLPADVTIKNSLILNVYAPQGSIIYSQQINSNSKVTLTNNIIQWDDQTSVYNYLTSTLVPTNSVPDPLLFSALSQHSQIWISKGNLITQNNIFSGLRYQTLFYLYQLSSWQETGSIINGYYMSTYPLIYTYKCTSISFTNTIISNVSPYSHSTGILFFTYVENTQNSVVLHNQDIDITYTGVTYISNRSYTKYGFAQFQQWSGFLKIASSTFNYNTGQNGALFLSQSSTTLTQSRLLQNDDQEIQIFCSNSTSVEDNKALFSQRILSSNAQTALIQACNFNGNYAVQGAALNLYFTTVQISNTQFQNNYATSVGGAIYSYQLSTSTNTITFTGNTFTNNQAGQGGAYLIEGISPTLSSITPNTFSQNTATFYGNNQVQSPVSMRLIYNGKVYNYAQGSSTIPTINYYGSGQTPGAMIIQLIGSDGTVLRQQTDTITVALNFASGDYIDSTVQLVGNKVFSYNEGVAGYNITSLIFIAKPPNQLKVKFSSPAVIIPILDNTGTITGYDTSYVFPLIINMRSCTYGEIYEATTGQCYACPSTKYSLVLGAEQCLSCPKVGVDNCPGYNIMNISAGYWRKNTSSDLIESCSNAASNCVGGQGSQLCYTGHIGALCEECDLYGKYWGEAYALSGSFSCGKCSEVSGNVQKVVLIMIWTLISTLLSVKSTIEQVQQYIQTQILIVSGFILGGKSSNAKNQAGVLIKILTSYFQVISVIFTFNLSTPSFFSTVSTTVGNPSQQMSVSMDCFFLQMSNMPVIYFRLVWQLINPMIFVVVSVIIYIVGVILKKVRKNSGYIWCTFIFLFITLQPSVILAFISTASCRTIAKVEYIKANVAYECYTSEHIYYLVTLVIPWLLIWALVIPIIFFQKLYSSRDKIYSNIWIRYRYGYLYMEYHPRAYFWEFVKMFEKITLTIIVNVYGDDTKVKGVLCFLTVVIYLIFSYIFKPYKENEQNRLDQRGNEAAALSMIMGVFIYQNSYNYLIIIGYLVLGFVNIVFVLDIVRGLLRGYTKKVDEVINKQFDKIAKILSKYPLLAKFLEKKKQSFVPIERVTYLWRRTSLFVHKWFKLRKEDPELKLVSVRLDEQLKPMRPIENEEERPINQELSNEKINLKQQSNDQQDARAAKIQETTTYQSSEISRSPPLNAAYPILNPNIVKIKQQQTQNSPQMNSNFDSIQEEIINLDNQEALSQQDKYPLNKNAAEFTPGRKRNAQGNDDSPFGARNTVGSFKDTLNNNNNNNRRKQKAMVELGKDVDEEQKDDFDL